MAQFLPPPSNQVDFALAPAGVFTSLDVPFELGVLNFSALDGGIVNIQRVGLERETPKGDWGSGTESAFFPTKNFVQRDVSSAVEITTPTAQFQPWEAVSAVDASQQEVFLGGIDGGNLGKEFGTITQALQIAADFGNGTDLVVWCAFEFLIQLSGDGGTGLDVFSSLNGEITPSGHGRGQESTSTQEATIGSIQTCQVEDGALHIFVSQFGDPWGMTPVSLRSVQEE